MYEKIIEVYPELINSDLFWDGTIMLQNDGDGAGDFIAKWSYEKPIPKGLKLGK